MELRAATPADLELLRRWDEQPHVSASDPNDDWGWEIELNRTPEWREHLIAQIDGRALGFVQIIDPAREESHYWATFLRIFVPSTSGSEKRLIWEKDTGRK